METIRLYDRGRSPSGWRHVIRPGQFVAFAQDVESGAACDAAGVPFTSSDLETCDIFDSLTEASTFCQARVAPPLLTVVHPSRSRRLEGNRRATRLTNWGAGLLVAIGPLLIWLDWARFDGLLILPTFVGINCLIFAARLLLLNRTYSSAERVRRERFRQEVEREQHRSTH
jgi:hypothetical protein